MNAFDPEAKETALRKESESWDTTAPIEAVEGDIPVIDIGEYRSRGTREALAGVSEQLRHACETVGFWQLVGHGISELEIAEAFAAVRRFHGLPLELKEQVRMDRPDWPLGGVGYLPMNNRKLPARAVGNLNEAFIIKGDRDITSDDNQWLDDAAIRGFRATVEAFAATLEQLTLDLLPIYAVALGLDPNWFAPGFEHPFWRLRMTRYPGSLHPNDGSSLEASNSVRERSERREARGATMPPAADVGRESRHQHGINPHVDTTFFTLLLQDSPGLTIYHTPKDRWINVPLVPNAFVVNSGELLRQWTNDRFLSVRHFANAGSLDNDTADRYSIPFFVNATRDYVMECIPTCFDDGNPAKYPPISYNQSQGVVQGE